VLGVFEDVFGDLREGYTGTPQLLRQLAAFENLSLALAV